MEPLPLCCTTLKNTQRGLRLGDLTILSKISNLWTALNVHVNVVKQMNVYLNDLFMEPRPPNVLCAKDG